MKKMHTILAYHQIRFLYLQSRRRYQHSLDAGVGRLWLISICVFMLLASVGSNSLGAREQEVAFEPRIRAVTIYPDRALVTRRKSIVLKKGKHILISRAGSPLLNVDSLRAT